MRQLGIIDPLDTKVVVTGADDGFEYIVPLFGKKCELDHLNLLGRLVYGMDALEYERFAASIVYTGADELKDIINLTQSLPNYTLVKKSEDLRTIGKNHYLNIHGHYALADEESLDFPGIGQALLDTKKGVKTPYGLVYENDIDCGEFFNGTNIPCYYDRDFVFNCRLSYKGAEEWLFLPCHENEIEKALHRLGADDCTECSLCIESFSSLIPQKLTDLFESESELELFELNRFAEKVSDFDSFEYEKLCAMWQYTDEVYEPFPTLTALADHMDDFLYVPKISNEQELGEYLIKDSDDYDYDPDLSDYYNYEGFGTDMCKWQRGRFENGAYIGIQSDISLDKILEPEGSQQMGGIS